MEKVNKLHNLHKLVEKTSEDHRRDIQLYTSGHLNFNKYVLNYFLCRKSEKNTIDCKLLFSCFFQFFTVKNK